MSTAAESIQKMILAHFKGDDIGFCAAVEKYITDERRKNHHVLVKELERTLSKSNGSASLSRGRLSFWMPSKDRTSVRRCLHELVAPPPPGTVGDELIGVRREQRLDLPGVACLFASGRRRPIVAANLAEGLQSRPVGRG